MSARPKVLRFYTDKVGKVRWQLRAGNGAIIADSGQGYTRLGSAEEGALSTMTGSQYKRLGDHGTIEGRDDVRVEWT